MMYIIKSDDNKCFEMDSMGWSWHADSTYAYRFYEKSKADDYAKQLNDVGYKCVVEEI